jgi:zinc protease
MKMRVINPVSAVLALGLCLGMVFAAPTASAADPLGIELPAGVTYVTSIEGIHEYGLENGLQVLFFPDIPDELTVHGCRPNGSTWYDRTNYFETFAATEENLEWALDLEADRMVNSFIAQEDLDSEMTVVRNEFEIGENHPRGILDERVYSTAYLWHNYGNTTIGARSDIEGVPIENLKAFYKKWYRPENAVLVVAGQFEPQHTMELVAQRFGPIRNPDEPLPELYTEEPPQDGERTVTLKRVGDSQAVHIAFHIPAGPHPDQPALAILAHILGDAPSGRLHKALVETQKASSVRARADRFRDPGLFNLTAGVRLKKPIEEVRDEMMRVAGEVASDPPTKEEVDRARAALLRHWEMRMRNSNWAAVGMSEWAAMGDWRLLFVYRDRLKEVTPEKVHEVAATYLIPTNRTVGLFIPTEEPERATVPGTPDLAEMIGAYKGGEGLALGEEFEPTPENIEAQLIREQLPVGLKMVMLPKRTRGETVTLSLSLDFGNEENLRGKARIGELAGRMLMRGTESHTRQEIEDAIDRLQASLRVVGSPTGAWGSIQVEREHLPEALRLLVEVLREPSFPENEFEQLREQTLAHLEESKGNPRAQAFIRLRRHLSPWPEDDVRYIATPEEEIEQIKEVQLKDLERFHRDVYGASSGELAIVGDFDPEDIANAVEELFGDWESPTPYRRLVARYEDRPVILESIETPDKQSAAFSAGLRVKMRDDDPDYAAVLLANFMTGGGFLNSRLATRIRREEGLSYSVGSRFWADSWDENAWFGAFAMYAPQNDARLLEAFKEEIRRIMESGFSDEEIAEAKSGWLQQRQVSRSQDRELAGLLVGREHLGRTLEWDVQLEHRLAELTADEVLNAFRRHVDVEKISIVRAGDFAGEGEES